MSARATAAPARMLRTPDVARQFGVARGTLLYWLRHGYVPRTAWTLTSRGYLIDPDAVAVFLRGRGRSRRTKRVTRTIWQRGLRP